MSKTLHISKSSENPAGKFLNPLTLCFNTEPKQYVESILEYSKINGFISDEKSFPNPLLYTLPPSTFSSMESWLYQKHTCFEYKGLIFPKEAEDVFYVWLIMQALQSYDKKISGFVLNAIHKSDKFELDPDNPFSSLSGHQITSALRIIHYLLENGLYKECLYNPQILADIMHPDSDLCVAKKKTKPVMMDILLCRQFVPSSEVNYLLVDTRPLWELLGLSEENYKKRKNLIGKGIRYLSLRKQHCLEPQDNDPLPELVKLYKTYKSVSDEDSIPDELLQILVSTSQTILPTAWVISKPNLSVLPPFLCMQGNIQLLKTPSVLFMDSEKEPELGDIQTNLNLSLSEHSTAQILLNQTFPQIPENLSRILNKSVSETDNPESPEASQSDPQAETSPVDSVSFFQTPERCICAMESAITPNIVSGSIPDDCPAILFHCENNGNIFNETQEQEQSRLHIYTGAFSELHPLNDSDILSEIACLHAHAIEVTAPIMSKRLSIALQCAKEHQTPIRFHSLQTALTK